MRPDNQCDDGEFQWTDDHGTDVEDVVVKEQPPVACYTNPHGDLVLRQSRWPDDDEWIWFQPQHAGAICRAILDRAGLAPADVFPDLVKDRPAALQLPAPAAPPSDNGEPELDQGAPSRGGELML